MMKMHCFFKRPATFAQPAVQRKIIDFQYFSNLGNSPMLASEVISHVRASVSGLLFSGRPLAICLAIISIIVFSINRVTAGGRESHIAQEMLENRPSLANAYAPAAVDAKFVVRAIIAPLPHANPHPECHFGKRIGISRGCAMSCDSSNQLVSPKASTAFASPGENVTRKLFIHSSAIASTNPSRVFTYGSERSNGESSKPFSNWGIYEIPAHNLTMKFFGQGFKVFSP